MMRSALVLLLLAPLASAAPVPKELKATGTTVGTWMLVRPDPQNPGQFVPGNQYWTIDAECGIIFGQTPTPAAGARPSEIFKFDPATLEVDHFSIGQPGKRNYMGVYELKGDELTICLDLSAKGRPKAVTDPGVTVWHLRRVRETK